MYVISYRRLREFFGIYRDAEAWLSTWYQVARRARWRDLIEVKQIYPHADLVGEFTVFNVKGNHYRLVARINYRSATIFVKGVFTHAEYDEGKWKT